MLKCRDIASLASEYADNNLTVRQRLAFAFHLAICGKCRAFIRQLKLVLEYCKHLPAGELDDAETEKIVASATGKSPA